MGRTALIAAALAVALPLLAAHAAEPDVPLYEQEPYDLLRLNDKEGTTIRVRPVDLPDRIVPKNPDPQNLLRVVLADRHGRLYQVAWSDVAELKLFEQLVLDEARRLTRDGKFTAAFDYFVFLRREHPKTLGLEEAETELNIAEIEHALAGDRPELAWARIERLRTRDLVHPRLAELTSRAARQSVEMYLAAEQPRAARAVAERFARLFPKHPTGGELKNLLTDAADRHLAAARAALGDRQYVAAQRAAHTAALVAADPTAARDVYREAVAAYPTLSVGVVETAAAPGSSVVPSWGERRLASLRPAPVLELTVTDGDPPRATYAGGANRWEPDDRDPLHFRLRLAATPGQLTAAAAAATLNAAATGVFAELRSVDPQTLDIYLQRPHPRIEALVAEVLAGRAIGIDAVAPVAPYQPGGSVDDTTTFLRNDEVHRGGPAEVTERCYSNEDETVAALLAGDVDMVDRIAPWQTARLRELRELRLVRYAVPSVHLLLFDGRNPRLQNAEFRRAICYALDRESILQNHLQPGAGDAASRVIDGVFSTGRTANDPLGYANDPLAESRAYDPQRAFLLAALADDGGNDEPLTLVHPPTLTAAKGAQRVAFYLRQVGIPVELRPVPYDEAPASADAADLTYVVVSSTEPAVDVQRWFGDGGLVNLKSVALDAALARAAVAESQSTLRSALFEVQRVVHDEALLAPLWQLSEYAVHRARVVPPAGLAPTSLYQQLERLRILPEFNETLP